MSAEIIARAPKRQNGVCHENERLLSLLETSEKDFISEYTESYDGTGRAKELYFFIVVKLMRAVLEDNIELFEKHYNQIEFVSNLDRKALAFLKKSASPIRGTNLIILACKYNTPGILKFLLRRSPGILNIQWSGVQDSIAQLHSVDDENHNAFYYAVRANSIKLLEILIDEWPNKYFADNPVQLDEVLAKAYSELKLKNVLLSEEIELCIQQKLIDLRFFSENLGNGVIARNGVDNISERMGLMHVHDQSKKDDVQIISERMKSAHIQDKPGSFDVKKDCKARIDLLLNIINLLKSEFLDSDVNARFLHVTKFITHNIYVLKRQLRSTYNLLPWEEMEFCLICFVSSHIKRQEINLLFNAMLSKSKIIKYLDTFQRKLKQNVIGTRYARAEHRNLKREEVVDNIISSCPDFKELYDDYQILRDYYSLEKISCHTKLMISVNPRKREGQLLITRGLQIIGEHFKNTVDSPMLSSNVSELLLSSLQKNTITVMKDVRNRLSHSKSLSNRMAMGKEEVFGMYTGIQSDAKKIDYLVTDFLHRYKMRTMRKLLKRITEIESLNEAAEIATLFSNVDFNDLPVSNSRMAHHEELEKLIKEFRETITDINEYEEEQFKEIDSVIASLDTQPQYLKTAYCLIFVSLKSICLMLNAGGLDWETVKVIKTRANNLLELSTPKMNISDVKIIVGLALRISESASLRLKKEDFEKIRKLIFEITCKADFEIENLRWMEKLKHQLRGKNCGIFASEERTRDETENKRKSLLRSKLSELRNIMSSDFLTGQITEKFIFCKSVKIKSVIGMLVLDILSILKENEKCLEDNQLFVDLNVPLLTGISLRDHLAHDGAFFYISPYDPAIAIVLNAYRLACIDGTNHSVGTRKLGQRVKDCPALLETKFKQELQIIDCQEMLFAALSTENASNLDKSVKNGADINGRSTDLRTALHFASVGPNTYMLNSLLQSNVDPLAKDILGQTPLHVAAEYGREHKVELLLKNGACVNDFDNHGKTPLHLAARNGHTRTVEVLLNYKACVFTQDLSGASSLYYGVRYNHEDVVGTLIKADVDFDINQTLSGFTLLYVAAESGNFSMFQFLLQHKADVNAENDNGGTPLYIAAKKGHSKIVQVLLQKRADVNCRFIDGFTPLHSAAQSGHKEIVRALLDRETKVDLRDKEDCTPLHYAACNGHEDIVLMLLERNFFSDSASVDNVTPLHLAAGQGHYNIVKTLLKHRADVQKRDKDQNTPLHYAALHGHKNVVRHLVAKNAKVRARNSNKATPLHFAAKGGHKEIMHILIRRNARMDAVDNKGFQPLHVLAKFGHADAISVLSNSNADMDARTSDNFFTPLYIAALTGSKETTVALIENHATLNCGNFHPTPLHAAARRGHIDVVKLLLRRKVRVDVQDIKGDFPLHAAVEGGCGNIVRLLVARGANIKKENIRGLTPLVSAIMHKNKEIVEILLEKGANGQVGIVSLLSVAVISGYSDIVDVLLRHGPIVKVSISDDFTSWCIAASKCHQNIENILTPLHLATLRGNEKIVKAIISKGVNEVNDVVGGTATALHFASAEGFADVVEVLIENNADVKLVSEKATALHYAAQLGHDTVVEILLNHPLVEVDFRNEDNVSPLDLAVRGGHLEVVKKLIRRKEVNLKYVGSCGETILHQASRENSVEIVECLVSKGCDMRLPDKSGLKPIHIAALKGKTDIVELFLKKGITRNDTTTDKTTPLHCAAQNGHLELVNLLVAWGAEVNLKDAYGASPLHLAAHFGFRNVVGVLLKSGAFLNDLYRNRLKPQEITTKNDVLELLVSTKELFIAVCNNFRIDVENAIEGGAVIDAKKVDLRAGRALLHIAAWKGFVEIVNILLDSGANPNILGGKGFTPLHFATKFSHLEIVIALLARGAVYNAISDNGTIPLDLSSNDHISNLLTFIHELFENVKNRSTRVTLELDQIKDKAKIKAILRARDQERHTLIEAAVLSNFPEVNKLKWLSQETTQSEYELASSLAHQGDFEGALAILNKALDERQAILGEDNPGTLDIQFDIAKLLYKQEKYQESLSILVGVCKKQILVFDKNHKDSLKTRVFIALVRYRQGTYEKAFHDLEDVYQMQRALFGRNNSDTLQTLFHMGEVLERLGRLEDALEANETVLNAWKDILGRNDPRIISVQKNIALVLTRQDRYEEALQVYSDVFKKEELVFGLRNTNTVKTWRSVAEMLCHRRRYNEALKCYEVILDIQESFLEPSHSDILMTRYNIATAKMLHGKYKDALIDNEELIDLFQTTFGPEHPVVLELHKNNDMITFMGNMRSSLVLEYIDLEYLHKYNLFKLFFNYL